MIWLYLIALAAALLLFAYLFVGYRLFYEFVRRGGGYKEKFKPEGPFLHRDLVEQMEKERLTLTTQDGFQLCGYLIRPEKSRGATVILVHGYLGCALDHMSMFVPFYLKAGFDVFLPDLRAHGESEGVYIGFGEKDSRDCIGWCNYLAKLFPKGQKILLHGVSMGATTVDLAASDPALPKEVIGVVSDCGFVSCKEQFTHTLKYITPVSAKLILPMANVWCKRLAGYDLFQVDCEKRIRNAKVPFLFIHGGKDDFVPHAMVEKLFEACPDPQKTKLIIPDATHSVSYLTDPKKYEEALMAFFERIEI